MGRLLALALAAGLALGSLWWLAGRDEARGGRTEPAAVPGALSAPEVPEPAPRPQGPQRERVGSEAARAAPAGTTPGSPAMPRAALAGRVRRADGTPVSGAEVVAESDWPSRGRREPLARARSQADGSFRLDCLGAGPFLVRARLADEARVALHAVREHVVGGRTDLELVLPDLCRLAGRVVDDLGQPLESFWVSCDPLSTPDEPATLVRGAHGAFALDGLPPGEWRLRVQEGRAHGGAEHGVVLPAPEGVALRVVRKATLRGLVLDPRGVPVRGAEVESPGSVAGRTDADGRFELRRVPAGEFELWAGAVGFAPSARQRLAPAPGATVEVVLHLGEPARVTGEVLAPGGRPLPGVSVSLGRPLPSGARLSARVWEGGGMTTTDADGRFAFDVAPGRVHLEVQPVSPVFRNRPPPEAGPAPRHGVTRALVLAPGESAHVRLVLEEAPVRLHGRIVLGGRTREGAEVRLSTVDESHPARVEAGVYEARLPGPGTYWLTVGVGTLGVQSHVDVPEVAELRHDIVLPLQRITGRVRDERGAPVAGVAVIATNRGAAPLLRCGNRATTDEHGAYALELLPSTYRVTVDPRTAGEPVLLPREERLVALSEGADRAGVDFVVRAAGELEGRVRAPDGSPVHGAEVTALARDGRAENDRTDREGRFLVRPLSAGRYWVEARLSGARGGPARTPWPIAVELQPGLARPLELRLVPATPVRVRTLDAAGAATHATLEAVDPLGRAESLREVAPGLHEGLLVAPGPYTLRTRHGGRLVERTLTLADAGAELALDFALE